jgi:hypothetical protein
VIQTSARSTAGAWSSPTNLSNLFVDSFRPRVAVDSAGDAAVVWSADNTSSDVATIATRPALGAWMGAKAVSNQVEDAHEPRVAVDEAGNVTVVWNLVANGEFTVRSITAPVGTEAWTGAVSLSPAMPEESELSVAVDPTGASMVTFGAAEAGTDVVQAVTRPVLAAPWSAPVPSPPRESPRSRRVKPSPCGARHRPGGAT